MTATQFATHANGEHCPIATTLHNCQRSHDYHRPFATHADGGGVYHNYLIGNTLYTVIANYNDVVVETHASIVTRAPELDTLNTDDYYLSDNCSVCSEPSDLGLGDDVSYVCWIDGSAYTAR